MDQQLITDLRARSKVHAGYDWKILRRAADALESKSLTPESVMAYFKELDISLLPWQTRKLVGDVEPSEKVPA